MRLKSVMIFFACMCLFAANQELLFAGRSPAVYAHDEKGCEGVGYTRQPSARYSPENLQRRLERNPADVDSLINLGIRLEEQDQFTQAYAEYEKAIQAKPECYLGYMFGGLIEQRISEHTAADANVKMHKAVSLNPSLRDDPNVQSYFRSHPPPVYGVSSEEKTSSSATGELLASANGFLIGVGVGLLLAAPFVYLLRRKRRTSG